MPSPEAAARNRSTQRRANWFIKATAPAAGSLNVARQVQRARSFSIFLPPALHTLPIAPHPIATLSLRHPKRSSYEFENSLQSVLFECQLSSCSFTTLDVSDTAEGLTSYG
ncbi:BQ5605_C006g03745 [Microbotryum silenes-dioicae]|uniref:BQ5605_C006g03741 protein n=1 Tax=Microbotryum silenes-dioicae TaxID=796604 RepID=A0A2X0M825_9BASI|nr:BQ5605_C006g03741 [Microbotryum silenes-dioicae]SGY53313.1 BQ5605_C006g03745 [Microbotryum silenes-dioicae]